jgi:hypothetical protein
MTTDKEKISAKIEQLKEELKDLPSGDYKDGVIYVLEEELIPFINSLITEHQGKEFKEEFEHYCVHGDIRNPNFEGPFGYDDIRKTAIHFANWQKEQLINKACEWLRTHVLEYFDDAGVEVSTFTEKFITEMEDKQ